MKKYLQLKLVILLIYTGTQLLAQTDSLELEGCRKIVLERYPLQSDFQKNLETSELKIRNIKTIYFPSLQLSGQYIHLADVVHLDIETPLYKIPVIGKDQYKIAIEARQVIYDGGLTKRRKSLEEINLMTDNQDIEVKLYQLNDQVNELYFMVLLFQEQTLLLHLTKAGLQEQLKTVESGVRNGSFITW